MKTIIATLSVLFLLLTSCVHHQVIVQNKAEFAHCKAGCDHRAAACQKVCRNNCAQCRAYTHQTAAGNYRHYVHEQSVKGNLIARELQSYRDPLQCRKITCSCSADHQVCMQSCGGVIHKHLQVAPVC